jgi:hypothetical protein
MAEEGQAPQQSDREEPQQDSGKKEETKTPYQKEFEKKMLDTIKIILEKWKNDRESLRDDTNKTKWKQVLNSYANLMKDSLTGITFQEFKDYLKDMAMLVKNYSSSSGETIYFRNRSANQPEFFLDATQGQQHTYIKFDEDVSNCIDDFEKKLINEEDFLKKEELNDTSPPNNIQKRLNYMLDVITSRLLKITQNVIKSSTERAKIYTSIYSTVLVYMKIKGLKRWIALKNISHTVIPTYARDLPSFYLGEAYGKGIGYKNTDGEYLYENIIKFVSHDCIFGYGVYELLYDRTNRDFYSRNLTINSYEQRDNVGVTREFQVVQVGNSKTNNFLTSYSDSIPILKTDYTFFAESLKNCIAKMIIEWEKTVTRDVKGMTLLNLTEQEKFTYMYTDVIDGLSKQYANDFIIPELTEKKSLLTITLFIVMMRCFL